MKILPRPSRPCQQSSDPVRPQARRTKIACQFAFSIPTVEANLDRALHRMYYGVGSSPSATGRQKGYKSRFIVTGFTTATDLCNESDAEPWRLINGSELKLLLEDRAAAGALRPVAISMRTSSSMGT
jgi:hypothetical protein